MKQIVFLLAIGLGLSGSQAKCNTKYNIDVLAYGGTASGVMAAVACARENMRVILIEPS